MVGSDKERPKGRVGSGSDNARGSPILRYRRSLIGYFNAIFGSLNIEHTALFKSALFCVQSSTLFEVFM